MSKEIVYGAYYQLRDKIFVADQVSKGTDEVLLRDFATHERFLIRYEVFSKLYDRVWKPAGASKILNRHPRTLRRYEEKGLIEKPFLYPDKGGKMVRFYSPADIENIREIISGIHQGAKRKDHRITNNRVPNAYELKKFFKERLKT